MKTCFSCKQTKEIENFYKHSGMADGRLGKCKECSKRDSRKNRKEKVDFYRDYDKKRGARQTEQYRKNWRAKNKQKYKAHIITNNALKNKIITRQPCEICSQDLNVHAHHDDYLQPLNVRWLCPIHHKEWHDLNGEGKNGR